MELHLATQKVVRAHNPEHEIGIRDGCGLTPASITGRAGICPRTLRPYLEHAFHISPGDGSSPRPNRHHIYSRQDDRKISNRVLSRIRDASLRNGDVDTRPSHIKSHQPIIAQETPQMDGPDDARSGSRQKSLHRSLSTAPRIHYAAIGFGGEDPTSDPQFTRVLLERVQIAPHAFAHVRVKHGNERALIFPLLRP